MQTNKKKYPVRILWWNCPDSGKKRKSAFPVLGVECGSHPTID